MRITPYNSRPDQVSISPLSRQLDNSNWNTGRNFTITAVNDTVPEVDESGTITHNATSNVSGSPLNGIVACATMFVNVYDNDGATPTYTRTPTATIGVCPLGSEGLLEGPPCQGNPTATLTPSPTLTITLTPEPFEIWHVSCGLATLRANARTYATINGRVERSYPFGTVLYRYETRTDALGNSWFRVTSPYEVYNGRNTLWISQVYAGQTIFSESRKLNQS